MKIVLRADVDNVGKKGDMVDVADGFARNYLVPKGLALTASRGRREAGGRDAPQPRRAATGVSAKPPKRSRSQLSGRTVTVLARAGEGGRLFGSVTAADIADAVQRAPRRRDRPAQARPRRAAQGARHHRAPRAAARRRRRRRHRRSRRAIGDWSSHSGNRSRRTKHLRFSRRGCRSGFPTRRVRRR